jgi:hypothetical protein
VSLPETRFRVGAFSARAGQKRCPSAGNIQPVSLLIRKYRGYAKACQVQIFSKLRLRYLIVVEKPAPNVGLIIIKRLFRFIHLDRSIEESEQRHLEQAEPFPFPLFLDCLELLFNKAPI